MKPWQSIVTVMHKKQVEKSVNLAVFISNCLNISVSEARRQMKNNAYSLVNLKDCTGDENPQLLYMNVRACITDKQLVTEATTHADTDDWDAIRFNKHGGFIILGPYLKTHQIIWCP